MNHTGCSEFKMGFCTHEKFFKDKITKPCIKIHTEDHILSPEQRKNVLLRWNNIIEENNIRQVQLRDIIKYFYVDKYYSKYIESIDHIYKAIDGLPPVKKSDDILRLKKLLNLSAKVICRMPDGEVLKTSQNLLSICKICAALIALGKQCTHKLHGIYAEIREKYKENMRI